MYLKYTQTQLKMSKNIGTISCNPLEMMIGGLFNEEEANKTFSQCMEYSTAEQTQKTQDELSKQYNSEIEKLIEDISNNRSYETITEKQKQEKLFELLNQKTSNVKDLVYQQQMINNTFDATDADVSGVITRFQNVADKFKDVMSNI
tara:strand:- start:563 stop:1003 length:441 start_codon:yes stop_codon:yes gene_type:complete